MTKFKGCLLLFWGILSACVATTALSFDRGVAGSVEVKVVAQAFFSPQDDVAEQIIDAVRHAHNQVLVQAFSFTHEGIARALIDAYRRGVDVELIADREQTEKITHNKILGIAAVGVPVWLDGQHQSAHNKVMVIDAGTSASMVITGSFNFTNAAQYKNAENIVLLSGSTALADEYVANWKVHRAHAQRMVVH